MVVNDRYEALIQENNLLEWNDTHAALSTAGFLNYKPAINISAHPFEAMRLMNEMGISVLPVIDREHKYVGAMTKDTLFKYFVENSGVDNTGGVITLEIAPRNYSLYEIARICENEDVTILSVQVHTNEIGILEVTLKLNRTALEAVTSSFERHNYHVKEVYGDDTSYEDIEGNYNLLMNYINM